MIQDRAAHVQAMMAASLFLCEPMALRPPCQGKRAGLRVVMGAASGIAMARNGTTKRADPWSDRVVDIAERQDRAAFAELFAFFAPRLKAYLQRRGTSEAQAEDLAQETMLAVWRKARLYDPANASAATWIFTIARNLRIDAARRDRRGGAVRVDEIEAEFEIDDAPGADVQLMSGEAETRVREALKQLPEDQLRVIQLSFFEERPHSEIARALQIPLGTVKSRVRLAVKRMRGLLDELQ